MLNKLSLRIRLTILIGLIIVFIAVCLTIISIYNADINLINLFEGTNMESALEKTSDYKFDFGKENSNEDKKPIVIDAMPTDNPEEQYKIYSVDQMMGQIVMVKSVFAYSSILYMLVIIIIGMIITYILAGKALKPVKDLSSVIKNINEHNLAQGVENFNTKDEIGNLAESFNLMMERLNKSFKNQKQFAFNVAHELKNPLATIKASIQVLNIDENPSIEDYKESVEIIDESVQRLILVVDDLLKLANKDIDKFTDEIFMQDIFNNILEELKAKIEEKKVQVYLEECNHVITGNKILIYRALFNLLENSVKYNKTGGTVKISTVLMEEVIKINISDTGIGIADKDIDKIFEPFYRGDKSHPSKIGGNGLGLSIVKSILEDHDGSISVKSKIAVGTEFEILLPKKS